MQPQTSLDAPNHYHYPMDSILAGIRAFGGRCVYPLGVNDTAWDPTSKGRVIRGPAIVTYTQHADGGIDVTVDPATLAYTKYNVRAVLERELTLTATLDLFGFTHATAGALGVQIVRDANGSELTRGRADQVWNWLCDFAGVPLEG